MLFRIIVKVIRMGTQTSELTVRANTIEFSYTLYCQYRLWFERMVVAQNVTMSTLTALADQLAEDVSVIESRQRKRTADQIAKAQELASDWWEKQNN